MGKIVRKGVEYGGSSNSADCIKYNDTKSVKEAIDEIKASSSSNPTAASITFNNTDTGLNATNVQDAVTEVNGKLINQSVGNSITLSNIIGIIGYAFDNKLVVAYVPLPFVTKNTNYEIKFNRVDFDSFGNVLSKCNVSVKTNCGFSFTCTPDNATYGMAKMITNLSFTIIFR